ncbi:MAG: hypothetical protein RRC07_01750 [Anaerolineae bacterium]|nr:hypothetical protein [Anaerolineae bacterium]
MAHQALFSGLIVDEYDNPVATATVGGEPVYVIDDDGFLRHIDAKEVDRKILSVFVEQLQEHKDLAVAQMLQMLGSDDLMTKAAIESQVRNVTVDQILAQGLPPQARDMLGMMGFRVIINVHGELVRLEQPTLPGGEED